MRNTIDTEFIFLSKAYFAVMPQVTTIPAFGNTKSYKTVDASLINMGILLSKIQGGDSFTFQNKLYQGDFSFTNIYSYRSPSGIQGNRDSSYLLFSSVKNFCKHYTTNSSYTPISQPWQKTNRINVIN